MQVSLSGLQYDFLNKVIYLYLSISFPCLLKTDNFSVASGK